MSSGSKRWNLKNIFATKAGCRCGPKATDVVEPKPYPKPDHIPLPSATNDGGEEEDSTSTAFSINIDSSTKQNNTEADSGCPKIWGSFTVLKDSKDPYEDFRRSMLEMIFEKQMYSTNDLQQLLCCFLELNAPRHHEVIVRAFVDLWNNGTLLVEEEEEEETSPCSSPH